MSELITVDVVAESVSTPLQPDSYDYDRLPPELRDQAMLAQGTVLKKLSGAVERVIDAGNTLRWAKATLPHGEYLPWVQQACGLKPQRAAELIRAAEWVEMSGRPEVLSGVQSLDTLFILSADATPEDVREWVMERCAAGEPPTRKEVQERKRQSQGKASRTLTQEIKAALKISPEARQLAANAEHITTRQLMDELDADDLPKGIEHQNTSHLFLKNGTGWWKLPHQQPVQVPVSLPRRQADLFGDDVSLEEVVTIEEASVRMGYPKPHSLRNRITPSKIKRNGNPKQNGWEALPHAERNKCIVRRC